MKFIIVLALLFTLQLNAQIQNNPDTNCINPIKSSVPESSNQNLAFLDKYVNGKEIISLGEPTHGSKEVFQMKHKVIKYLVEEYNFTVFAIEANSVECDILNAYIQTGKGNPAQLLSQLGYWVWTTREVLDMVIWMKKYNSANENQLKFTGFDMQSYSYALRKINQITESAKLNLKTNLEGLNSIDSIIYNNKLNGVYQVNDSLRETMYEFSNNLNLELQEVNMPKNINRDSLLQYSNLVLQYSTRYSKNRPQYGFRDSCMAQNLSWIKDQNPNQKIIIWAHNGHVKRDSFTMGQYLANMKLKPYVIGFSTYEGTYTAISEGAIVDNNLQTPNSNCYEYYFNKFNSPIFFTDLKCLSTNHDFILHAMDFREIGSMKRDEQFFKSNLIKEYDAIIHIKKTNASNMLY